MKRTLTLIATIAMLAMLLAPLTTQPRANSPTSYVGASMMPALGTIKPLARTHTTVSQSRMLRSLASQAAQALLPSAEAAPLLRATRAISIPFGIASPVQLSDNGRHIFIEGHGGCAADQMVRVHVTVTQSTTGALARGHTQEFCTGDLQHWTIKAVARGPARFVAGPAEACGVARTRFRGKRTDTFQWCRDITLVTHSK